MALGWVYVLSNPDMPGLVKIGQSAADPDLRASELHTTGVPSPFAVEYKGLFENYASLERAVHQSLSEHRHNSTREFFRISSAQAVSRIRQLTPVPAKYEVASFTSSEGDSQELVKNDFDAECERISIADAQKEAGRGWLRLLESGYSPPARCPSCTKT